MPTSAVFMNAQLGRPMMKESPSVGSYDPAIVHDIGLKSKLRHGTRLSHDNSMSELHRQGSDTSIGLHGNSNKKQSPSPMHMHKLVRDTSRHRFDGQHPVSNENLGPGSYNTLEET